MGIGVASDTIVVVFFIKTVTNIEGRNDDDNNNMKIKFMFTFNK